MWVPILSNAMAIYTIPMTRRIRMLVKARLFVAFGLLLLFLHTTTSAKAAPLQVIIRVRLRLSDLFWHPTTYGTK